MLNLAPGKGDKLIARGAANLGRKRHKEALQDFSAGLKTVPDDAVAWYMCGESRLALHDAEGAVGDYRDLITGEPRVGYWDAATGFFTATKHHPAAPEILTHFPMTLENFLKIPHRMPGAK